jgi:catechol-2,3-dioxygenase
MNKPLVKKVSLILALAFVYAAAWSQSTSRPGFIGLFVNNVDSMKTWYAEKLGFKILDDKKVSNDIGFAMLEGHGIWIEMVYNSKTVSKASFKKSFPESTHLEGLFKLGIYTTELEKVEKELKEKGVKFRYPMLTNDTFAMKLFIVEDPEGNLIQFYNTSRQKF